MQILIGEVDVAKEVGGACMMLEMKERGSHITHKPHRRHTSPGLGWIGSGKGWNGPLRNPLRTQSESQHSSTAMHYIHYLSIVQHLQNRCPDIELALVFSERSFTACSTCNKHFAWRELHRRRDLMHDELNPGATTTVAPRTTICSRIALSAALVAG